VALLFEVALPPVGRKFYPDGSCIWLDWYQGKLGPVEGLVIEDAGWGDSQTIIFRKGFCERNVLHISNSKAFVR